jgi:hypothetical protein
MPRLWLSQLQISPTNLTSENQSCSATVAGAICGLRKRNGSVLAFAAYDGS